MAATGGAGGLIRDARRRAGLSQVDLARRAQITQSVVSAYETGARQPSLPVLGKLVAAAGYDLRMRLVRRGGRLSGPLGKRLLGRSHQVLQIANRHGLTNVRVFGSVARGDDGCDSDIDLLVDVAPGVGLVGLSRCRRELEEVLEAKVDLVPAADLKAGVAAEVFAEAVWL